MTSIYHVIQQVHFRSTSHSQLKSKEAALDLRNLFWPTRFEELQSVQFRKFFQQHIVIRRTIPRSLFWQYVVINIIFWGDRKGSEPSL